MSRFQAMWHFLLGSNCWPPPMCRGWCYWRGDSPSQSEYRLPSAQDMVHGGRVQNQSNKECRRSRKKWRGICPRVAWCETDLESSSTAVLQCTEWLAVISSSSQLSNQPEKLKQILLWHFQNIQVYFYNVTHLQHQGWKKAKCRPGWFFTRIYTGQHYLLC